MFKNQINLEDPKEKAELNRNYSLHLAKVDKFYADLKQLGVKNCRH